jgi:hypothetical protein
MKTIDNKVIDDYNKGIELYRLRKDLGLIEFERTKELLLEYLPPVPAVIYDIGGGYGEYYNEPRFLHKKTLVFKLGSRYHPNRRNLYYETNTTHAGRKGKACT